MTMTDEKHAEQVVDLKKQIVEIAALFPNQPDKLDDFAVTVNASVLQRLLNPVPDLLRKMFRGWTIRQQTWTGECHTISEEDAMVQACDGDKILAYFLILAGEWSNDIVDAARLYGLEVYQDENHITQVRDIEPVPYETLFNYDLPDGVEMSEEEPADYN